MNNRSKVLAMFLLVLSGCVVVPSDYDPDDYRPRERARAECVDLAHDRGYRRIEVQTSRAVGRLEFEVALQARDRSGREVRLRCEYDARTRRARLI